MSKKKIELIDEGEPSKNQIRATDLLRWVAEHKDAYPLPEGVGAADLVFYDLPTSINFDVTHWVSVSKAYLAEFGLFVSPSQVSRWIKAGMPVRPDARLNYWEVLEWLENYEERNIARRATGWKY